MSNIRPLLSAAPRLMIGPFVFVRSIVAERDPSATCAPYYGFFLGRRVSLAFLIDLAAKLALPIRPA